MTLQKLLLCVWLFINSHACVESLYWLKPSSTVGWVFKSHFTPSKGGRQGPRSQELVWFGRLLGLVEIKCHLSSLPVGSEGHPHHPRFLLSIPSWLFATCEENCWMQMTSLPTKACVCDNRLDKPRKWRNMSMVGESWDMRFGGWGWRGSPRTTGETHVPHCLGGRCPTKR